MITLIDKKKYILLLIINYNDKNITINDLKVFSNINITFDLVESWDKLWIKKIDYYEYEMNEMKNSNKILYEIFDYFVGLAEIGIQLLQNTINNINNIDYRGNYYKSNSLRSNNYIFNNLYNICHKRILISMKKIDLYNPLNIIIDKKERDYAEFYKDEIFKGIYEDIFSFIKNNNIENINLFFIRLLYITPFFDLFDDQIKYNKGIKSYNYEVNDDKELLRKKINRLIIYNDIYINVLKKLYNFLYKKNYIINIDFFK